jgi:peptidoglycan hydrolase-like protein with peptidoglycan-binding domain
MIYLYNAINDLSELVSQGQRFSRVNFQYPGTVSRGQRGEEVSALQYMLSLVGEFYDVIPPVRVDGVYGADTEAAVRAFQQAAGLTVDGVAGERTWVQLYRVFAWLENEYLRNELRFPAKGNYGQTTRLQQYPGQELALGRSDG